MVVAIQPSHYPAPAISIPLTPLESAVPICLPSGKQNASITPLKSAISSRSQTTENTATLSLAESALTDFSPVTPLESALTKNTGGGGYPSPDSHFGNRVTPDPRQPSPCD